MHPTIVRSGPEGAVDVEVQVVPRASRSRIVGVHGDRLKIQLAAPPVDGAANQALIELFAKAVGVPRRAVKIVRGESSKRKTLRLSGTTIDGVREALELDGGGPLPAIKTTRHRRGLGDLLRRRAAIFSLVCVIPCAVACEGTAGPHLSVLLPEGDLDLERADNVSLVLDPGGPTVTYDVDGADFTVSLELDLDDVQRTASLYIARGSELLAWGRSAPFVLADADAGLTIFVGRPGALSTFPGEVTNAEGMIAAEAPGRGALLVADDGGTYLLSDRNLGISAGADFPGDPLPASSSALIGERSGGILRMSWGEAFEGWRFDPGADAWDPLEFTGDLDLGSRDDAAWLVDATAEHVLLLAGGDASDIIEIDLQPTSEGGPYAVRRIATPLDGPRAGATPLWITREGTSEGEGVLLFGGVQGELPLVYFSDGQAAGPDGETWTDAACEQVERAENATADVDLRVLCVGGLRGGIPTRDAALIRIAKDGPLTVDLLIDWLPEAFADPHLFRDDSAIYAQAAGSWLQIDPDDLSTEVSATAADRATGGHSVNLGTGVTFLVGGVTAEGQPVDRWQVFTPTPAS